MDGTRNNLAQRPHKVMSNWSHCKFFIMLVVFIIHVPGPNWLFGPRSLGIFSDAAYKTTKVIVFSIAYQIPSVTQ